MDTTKPTPPAPNSSASTSPLRFATEDAWTATVMADFDRFLQDHAAAEKKASGMALSMIAHYPDRRELVDVMSELAVEELTHYREVIKWLHARGLQLSADEKDPYVLAVREHIRSGRDNYLLDRLLTAGVIEARGCERFGLVAAALPQGKLQRFYQSITSSEARHFDTFVALAGTYFPHDTVNQRLDELLDAEAAIVQALPLRAALH